MTAVALAVGGWFVAACFGAVLLGQCIRRADAAQEQSWDDAAYLDECPRELSDAEVERRFARQVGWVR